MLTWPNPAVKPKPGSAEPKSAPFVALKTEP